MKVAALFVTVLVGVGAAPDDMAICQPLPGMVNLGDVNERCCYAMSSVVIAGAIGAGQGAMIGGFLTECIAGPPPEGSSCADDVTACGCTGTGDFGSILPTEARAIEALTEVCCEEGRPVESGESVAPMCGALAMENMVSGAYVGTMNGIIAGSFDADNDGAMDECALVDCSLMQPPPTMACDPLGTGAVLLGDLTETCCYGISSVVIAGAIQMGQGAMLTGLMQGCVAGPGSDCNDPTGALDCGCKADGLMTTGGVPMEPTVARNSQAMYDVCCTPGLSTSPLVMCGTKVIENSLVESGPMNSLVIGGLDANKDGYLDMCDAFNCGPEVCDASAIQACSDANRDECSSGSTECGDCLVGFKDEMGACVDLCDDQAKQICTNANKLTCSSGSSACGVCVDGFTLQNDICEEDVDLCDDQAKQICTNANKLTCSSGSATCGDCEAGYASVDDKCEEITLDSGSLAQLSTLMLVPMVTAHAVMT